MYNEDQDKIFRSSNITEIGKEEICVSYRGPNLEAWLVGAWLTSFIKQHHSVVYDYITSYFNQEELVNTIIPISKGNSCRLSINISDMKQSPDNSWFGAVSSLSKNFIKPPWSRNNINNKSMVFVSCFDSPHGLYEWGKTCTTQITDSTMFSSLIEGWCWLCSLAPRIVISDHPGLARMAIARGLNAIYVGGVDPYTDWWPMVPRHNEKFFWAKIKDTDPTILVKRCQCNSVKECHARSTPPPCVTNLSSMPSMSNHARSQIKVAIASLSKRNAR